MRTRFFLIVLLAAVIAAASTVVGGSLPGAMTSNTASDTTFVFDPPMPGVLIINPDAECAFEVGLSANYTTVVLAANSTLYWPGTVDTVITNPSTTQRVAVYGMP